MFDLDYNNITEGVIIAVLGTVLGTAIIAFFIWLYKFKKKSDSDTGQKFLFKQVKIMTDDEREDERKRFEKELPNIQVAFERKGNQTGAKKLAEAQEALAEGDLPKADKLFAEIEDSEELALPQFADISFARGYIAEFGGYWKEAAQHYTRAAKIDPSFETLMKAQNLALAISDYDSALPLGTEAKKLAIAKYGKDSAEYVNSLNNLGGVYQGKRQNKVAERLYNEAIIISRKLWGEYDFRIASTLNNLAEIYRTQADFTKAEQFFKQAIEIDEKALGKEHQATATGINNLGNVYKDQKRYAEAESFYQQALTIRKKVLPKNHPDIATNCNNLALLYQLQGKYEKVEQLYLQAINIFEITLGDEHLNTKGVKYNYETFKKDLANAESGASQ